MMAGMNHPFTPTFASILVLAGALLATSCGREEGRSGNGPVLWPELAAFDELAYWAEGLAKVKDREGLLQQRTALLEAGWAVSPKTLPENAANLRHVHQLLGDLSSLVNGFAQVEMSDERLFALAEGLHPVVEALIEATGMPHIHANEGPNEGFLHPLFGSDGAQVGTAEIKLHDDAGDVEVWLTRGGLDGEAWDLPVATTLTMDFPALGKKIVLAVRDDALNADESGKATIRGGATNYFVFPGETGIDASWLMGAEFAAKAVLAFEGAATATIVLRPHAHHEEGEE
jgi:hypothetical protein